MIFPRLQGNNRTLALLVSMVVTLTFTTIVIIPPFYDWFCRVTGFGGTTAVAETGADTVLDQTVKVRFDASLEQGMPWTFKPVVRSMEVRIGETGLAFYEAHNPTDRPVAGTASFNVYPYAAGGYFTKIECFCFTEQVLQPGETVQMPVSFYVDPAMVEDIEGQFVHEIVLSYTFHETPLPDEQAALQTPAADNASVVN
ncbi:cytochrome c oxidase assembly protein [Tabrizicola sp.]|uniref:cytochrome c oxidase assembly protein n=1 Tax=Tabrizicola sp. TaxID=2005166 RepID=UPI0027370D93|nr:cytochrome c oxidase assembly protein [Tabrizicola sp.]MDP3197809.1 cytochrome c oxidase assembly protein [Tabrizicola sp.]